MYRCKDWSILNYIITNKLGFIRNVIIMLIEAMAVKNLEVLIKLDHIELSYR